LRKIKVGTYYLNGAATELWFRDGEGADFDSAPSKHGSLPRITTSADTDLWNIISHILHEANEFVLVDMGLRYYDRQNYPIDAGGYLFVLDHHKFSLMNQYSAYFLSQCLNDVKKALHLWKHPPKKKSRKRKRP
jgi:hypothetical protein